MATKHTILAALISLLAISAPSMSSDTGKFDLTPVRSLKAPQAETPLGIDFNILFDLRLAAKHQNPLVPAIMTPGRALTNHGKPIGNWRTYLLGGWDVAQDHGTIGAAACMSHQITDQIGFKFGGFVRATPGDIPFSGGLVFGATWQF